MIISLTYCGLVSAQQDTTAGRLTVAGSPWLSDIRAEILRCQPE